VRGIPREPEATVAITQLHRALNKFVSPSDIPAHSAYAIFGDSAFVNCRSSNRRRDSSKFCHFSNFSRKVFTTFSFTNY